MNWRMCDVLWKAFWKSYTSSILKDPESLGLLFQAVTIYYETADFSTNHAYKRTMQNSERNAVGFPRVNTRCVRKDSRNRDKLLSNGQLGASRSRNSGKRRNDIPRNRTPTCRPVSPPYSRTMSCKALPWSDRDAFATVLDQRVPLPYLDLRRGEAKGLLHGLEDALAGGLCLVDDGRAFVNVFAQVA